MNLRRRSLRFVAMAVVVSLPLLGMSGVASARVKAGCHKTHSCKSGGGSGSGTGGVGPAPITVQIDPNPLVETGQSEIVATVQVETSPSFAGDAVNISSSQLAASCVLVLFENNQVSGQNNVSVILDNDGNATVLVAGSDCAPGSSVIEVDLEVAPYYTALGTLVANPPAVTPPGVTGYPTTSGTVTTGEVETGDTKASGDSDVYAIFYVETNPVYAEQKVEISSNQLTSRCLGFSNWFSETSGNGTQTILDDDGNAVFIFVGISCAAGTSTVTADVEAGTHPTYTTSFNIVAPQPTI
jgi:hypothetical protein